MLHKETIRIQAIAVLVGMVLLVGKFFAYYLTASNTILTDALESIVNVVAGALSLYSLVIAAMPKDENHPYGHGKIEFISAGVEGALIAIAGFSIIIKSIYSFFYPQTLSQLDLGILITGIAGIVNYILGGFTEFYGKKHHSLALIASGKHLKSDAYSTVGLVVGLGIIYFTNLVWLDSLIAIGFGGLILWTGFHIVKESVAGIMDEVDYPLVGDVVKILNENRQDNWIDIHNLRIIKYGNALHFDCHLTVPWYFDVRQAHKEVDALEKVLEDRIKSPVELFVHVDACIPDSCVLCKRKYCPVREAKFLEAVDWTSENVMKNRKHELLEK